MKRKKKVINERGSEHDISIAIPFSAVTISIPFSAVKISKPHQK
jgi:hypothetical protein